MKRKFPISNRVRLLAGWFVGLKVIEKAGSNSPMLKISFYCIIIMINIICRVIHNIINNKYYCWLSLIPSIALYAQ